MIRFNIENLIPGFILRDKNGYALAKALEAGMNAACGIIEQGVNVLLKVDEMPEWRLDEMAYELGCLYDYNADLEKKRKWIRGALSFSSDLGTPQAIYNYLEGYFDGVVVEEGSSYGGDPFHFRVTVFGDWTQDNIEWATTAVSKAKNVRSILDMLGPGVNTNISVGERADDIGRFYYRHAGTDVYNVIEED